ncbi:MAG: hypothetical protein KI790_18100 [Cyclobacteriaceae bacterium]|nr:hypothetical protein [Cyclobacteriaceae bacterium HetDA_MAG_MS6]
MEKLKNAVVMWLIVYVLITGLFYGLNTWLSLFPIYFRTLVLSGLMVFTLQFLILPGMRKWKEKSVRSGNH